ncbi:MAG: spermidine/putrescine ABC transporter substrate-binding protein [Ruminococcaceae bacterium]|nr:spermidine/putrescine ABC transporter substrate-binding protein [Oscillospiraceae bacterium]
MKKIISLILVLMFVIISICGCGSQSNKVTLRVYNWGEFIDMELLDKFEEETGIKVLYDVYTDNESLYAKIRNSGEDSYDIIVPSDYMIKKMISEDMLAKIDFNNIPNIKNINEAYLNPSYDPSGEYSVPYFYGMVGILYNKNKVDGKIKGMKDLFDEKYSRNVCMLYSMRDTIGMTLKMLGYSMNDTDPAHINEAKEILIKQKPNVLAYGTDELVPKVADGSAAMAMVYSGDGIVAATEDPENVEFVIPEEGSNIAMDSMVILKTSKHKSEAEKFINFMLDAENSAQNAIYTGYSTPNKEAWNLLSDEVKNDSRRYLTDEMMAKCEEFTSDNSHYVDAWDEILAQ